MASHNASSNQPDADCGDFGAYAPSKEVKLQMIHNHADMFSWYCDISQGRNRTKTISLSLLLSSQE